MNKLKESLGLAHIVLIQAEYVFTNKFSRKRLHFSSKLKFYTNLLILSKVANQKIMETKILCKEDFPQWKKQNV